MNKKIRIFLFSYSGGNWTWPIEDALVELSKLQNIEVFILSNRKDVNLNGVYNLDDFKNSSVLEKILNLKSRKINISDEILSQQYEHEKVKYIYRKIKKKNSKKTLEKWGAMAELYYNIIEPDLIIFWNAQFGISRAFRNIAERLKIPFYFIEKGVLPQSFYFDINGTNFESEIAKTNLDYSLINERQKNKFKKKIEEIDNKGYSAWEQPKRKNLAELKKNLGIKENQKVIFFPGQVDHDSNIVLFSKYFKNSKDVLMWIIKDLKNDNFFVLVKPHPKGFDKKEELDLIIGHNGISTDKINIIDAIYLSDIIITINSTVGFEALIREKPVIQLGMGILSNKGLVTEYNPSKNSYMQILQCINDFNENKTNIINKVLKLGSFLNDEYYCFRDNGKSINEAFINILKKQKYKNKNFLYDEINILFKYMTSENFRTFLKKRIFNKFKISFVIIKIFIIKIVKFFFPGFVKKIKEKLDNY